MLGSIDFNQQANLFVWCLGLKDLLKGRYDFDKYQKNTSIIRIYSEKGW